MSDDQLSGVWPSKQLPSSWAWVPFDQFWLDFTDSQRKLPQKHYLPEGLYSVVDQGEALIGGYTNDETLLSSASLPAIVFGDHTRTVKFIDVPFVQGADGVRVLGAPEGIDPKFAFKAVSTVTLPNKGYSRHFKFLKATSFPLPPYAEQRRIVAKLDSLIARIARARAELDRVSVLAARLRRLVLSKAFAGELTKPQKMVPRKMLPVGDLIQEIAGGWSPRCENFPADFDSRWGVITTTSIQAINFDSSENKALPIGINPRPQLEVRVGDVLITRKGPRIRCGVCCFVEHTRPKLMVCDTVYRLRMKAIFNAELFACLMSSPEMLGAIDRIKSGGNESGLNITHDRLKSLQLPIWDHATQAGCLAAIKSSFARADRLEAEAARARKLLDRLESAILAKAFRGELVPQDPSDEPASVLLDRIRAERDAAPKAPRGRKARA